VTLETRGRAVDHVMLLSRAANDRKEPASGA
jgi:hypothetical protein